MARGGGVNKKCRKTKNKLMDRIDVCLSSFHQPQKTNIGMKRTHK